MKTGISPVGKSFPASHRQGINRSIQGNRLSGVQNTSLLHRFFEVGRCSKLLSLLRVLGIENDNDVTLIAVGGMIDPRIDKPRASLHFGMLIEDRTPLAVISDFVPDNHHSHTILPLLPANFYSQLRAGVMRVTDSSTTIPCHSP